MHKVEIPDPETGVPVPNPLPAPASAPVPQAPQAPQAPQEQQLVHLNWSYFKPEFSRKPDERHRSTSALHQ